MRDAVARLRPGDTLVLREGEYGQSVLISGLKGREDAPITIRGEGRVVLRPPAPANGGGRDGILFNGEPSEHVILENLRVVQAVRAGILINGSRHITLRRCSLIANRVWGVQTTLSDFISLEECELAGSKEQHGVYFSTTDHPRVSRSRIHHNAGCGIHCNGDLSEGGDGMVTGGLFEDNFLFENGRRGGAAINMDGVQQTVARNNLIVFNHAGGITSFKENGLRSGAGNEFRQNTVYFGPGSGRFALQIAAGAAAATVEANILFCGRGPALEIDSGSLRGLHSDRNVFGGGGGVPPVAVDERRIDLSRWQAETKQDLKSAAGDPQFADPAATNFVVKAGSPARALKAGWSSAPDRFPYKPRE